MKPFAAVPWLAASRLWSLVAGPITILLLAHHVSSIEQGYWYTLQSLATFAALFELGFGQVITTHAAHECNSPHRLAGLVRTGTRWMCMCSVLFLLTAIPAGFFMLGRQHELPTGAWLMPWIALCIGTAITMILGPVQAALEGIGQNTLIASMRLSTGIASSVTIWVFLASGAGLWSVAAGALTLGATSATALVWLRRDHIHTWLTTIPSDNLDWNREIMPLQWKFALSWLAGWVIFQSITPLTMLFDGAQDAGRVGMGMVICWAIIGLSSTWLNAAYPHMAQRAAQNDIAGLDALFRPAQRQGVMASAVISVAGLTVLAVIDCTDWKIGRRLPSTAQMAPILMIAVAHTYVSGLASWLRAFRRETFLLLNLSEAALILFVYTCFGQRLGTWGMVGVLCAIHGLAVPIIATVIYTKKRATPLWAIC